MHVFFTALEDNTDELLELIAKSDGILSPDEATLKTRETIRQRSAGKFSSLHPSVTPSSSRKKRERDSFPELNRSSDHKPRFTDELEAYTECRLKGNFTSAPKTVGESSGVVSKRDSGKADLSTETEHSNPGSAIETLLDLLQEYVILGSMHHPVSRLPYLMYNKTVAMNRDNLHVPQKSCVL